MLVPLKTMIPVLVLLAGCAGSNAVLRVPYPDDARRRLALETVAQNPVRAFQTVAARLRSGIRTEFAKRQLDTLLDTPSGDMFWTYPAVGFYYYCRDIIDNATRARFRSALGSYTPYRGDTENHFLMHYSFLLLFAQEWPEMTADEWFNHKSSHENYAEARDYLEHWMDDVARKGMTEFDAPRYHYFYITPLLILRDFTQDTALRARFDVMLEWMMADFAADYLDGNYCGAHSRDADATVIAPRTADMTSYGEFYFEDTLRLILPDLAYAAMSQWRPPEIIRQIAHDRAVPFLHREIKRSRGKMRYSAEIHTAVHRTTWMTQRYAIGSMEGGLQQPIQQHTWDVTFAARRPNNTLFTLHPYASALELGTFFPEEPELMESGVTSQKAGYGSEDKWLGGSPYERVAQHNGTLVAMYDIPPETRWQHVDLFLPTSLDTLIPDINGWIIATMEGAWVAIGPVTDGEQTPQWAKAENHTRGRWIAGKVSFCVETASVDRTTLAAFIRDVTEKRPEQRLRTESGVLRYTGVQGDYTIDLNDGHARLLPDDATSAIDTQMLFDGPHLRSVAGSGRLELRSGNMFRLLEMP